MSHSQSTPQWGEEKPNRGPRVMLAGGLGLVFLAMLLWADLRPSSSTAAIPAEPFIAATGVQAADFSLATLSGEQRSLSDHAGEVVVVNFWATWCPPCRAEMPGINHLYETYREAGLTVLAINAREDAATVNAFVQPQDFSFPILLDRRGQVIQQYTVHSFPTTVVIDRTGTIRHMQSGLISEAELERIVLPLLGG